MKQIMFQEKYPIYHLEVTKDETTFTTVDEIVDFLKQKIEETDKVAYIGVFDHYTHTKNIEGPIDPKIKDAKNVLFCFGLALPNAHVLSVRPRSIGVADCTDHFTITFLEAPMPPANLAMEEWAKAVKNK